MKAIISGIGPFITGIVFALGLGISGMTEAKRIIAFLDVAGDWQADLLFVMGGALIVYAIAFRLITKRTRPLCDEKFYLPENKKIDPQLISGAALFGLGWGITGLCPGPGLVALISAKTHAIVFVATMVIGMKFARKKSR